jgi:hypothetical protein
MNGALHGIVSRQFYAAHHFEQALRLSETLPEEADASTAFRIVFGDQDTDWRSFEVARKRAEANLVACAESMNVVPDLLGHVIYFALGCNLDQRKLLARNVSLGSVLKRISNDPACSALVRKLHVLINHDDYRYLSDLVNTGKHRSIVAAPYSIDLTGEEERSHGVRFSAFEYDGRAYEPRWVKPFLDGEFTRRSTCLVAIGEEVNRLVGA